MPLLVYLFLKINVLVIGLMIVAFLARALWGVSYAVNAPLSLGDRGARSQLFGEDPFDAGSVCHPSVLAAVSCALLALASKTHALTSNETESCSPSSIFSCAERGDSARNVALFITAKARASPRSCATLSPALGLDVEPTASFSEYGDFEARGL